MRSRKGYMDKITVMFILIQLMIILNIKMSPNFLLAQIFGIVYLIVVYKFFSPNFKKFIYHTTILFSIIDFGLVLPLGSRFGIYYFYITLFIYMLTQIVLFLRGETRLNFDKIFKSKYMIFLWIFIIYVVGSFFIASDKKAAVKSIFVYVIMFTYVFMLIIENKTIKDFKETAKLLFCTYSGVIFIGLLKILGIVENIRNVYSDMGYTVDVIPFLARMPIVFFYNPNNYGVFLVIAMSAILIKLFYSEDRREKIILSVVLVLSQINLIFTSCRTGWITLYAVCLFTILVGLIFRKKDMVKFTFKYIVVSLIIFVGFSMLPGMDLYYGKFNSTPILNKLNIINKKNVPKVTVKNSVSIGGSGSLSERVTLMHDVMDGVFKEHHFIGFGAGNTMNYIKSLANTQGIYNIHSLWFELLGDFGIGMLLYYIINYLTMLLSLLRKFLMNNDIEVRKYSFMILVGLVGFVFLAFAPSTVLSYTPYWMLLGLSFGFAININ